MGCCMSDTIPPIPANMRADPEAEAALRVEVARLGYFGGSRDFGIWFEKRPSSSDDQKDNIWMWFNKADFPGEGPLGRRIDLENFKRTEGDKDQRGKILYSAYFKDSPNFQIFQRHASHGLSFFSGFLKGRPDEDDNFYVNHATHMRALNSKRHAGNFSKMLDGCIISKWSFVSAVNFQDGNLGRGEAYFFGEKPLLEVFSKGTVVTSYYETKETREERVHFETHKCETEFVDSIQFRFSVNAQLIAEWVADGDSYKYGDTDVFLDTPLFNVTLQGGWFSRSVLQITTKQGIPIDSALALLVAHVTCTEFSVAEVKKDLKVSTPHHPPRDMTGLIAFDAARSAFTGIQVSGAYSRGRGPMHH